MLTCLRRCHIHVIRIEFVCMKTVLPVNLPLSDRQFRHALCTGHGRALQHVQQYGSVGLDEAIIDAVVHCRVWDPQCEPGRGDWLVEILNAADLCQPAINAIREVCHDPVDTDNFFDRDQQCAVAGKLAKPGGFPDARDLLYGMFGPAEDSADVLGLEAIIDLDGQAGLVFVCRELGRLLADDLSACVDEEPLALFDNRFGEGEARKVLETKAREDHDIWRYVQTLRCDEERPHSSGYRKIPADMDLDRWPSRSTTVEKLSGAEVVSLVRSGADEQSVDGLVAWGRKASTADLEVVLEAILAEQDVVGTGRLLRCFTRRGFPRFDERMMALLGIEEELIRHRTVTGMSRLNDQRVRRLAMQRLAAGFSRDGLRLLRANFKPSDVRVLEQVLHSLPDPNENHWMIKDLLELLEENRLAEGAGQLLLFAYEHTPCMLSREDSVKLLLRSGAAPDWVLEECRFDGSPHIRDIVIGKSKRRSP